MTGPDRPAGRDRVPGRALALGAPLTVDCSGCPVAGDGCAGCMVTALLQADRWRREQEAAEAELPLDAEERLAVWVLLDRGLVTSEEASRAHARRETLPLRDGGLDADAVAG